MKKVTKQYVIKTITPSVLDQKLAQFLRQKRGDITYYDFGQMTGFTPSTIFRLENAQQSITLRSLHRLIQRLNCSLDDIFNS